MPNLSFTIVETDLDTALRVLESLPEFDPLKPYDYYRERLGHSSKLILCAFDKDKPVGCKIGYDHDHDGSFYSWLGGVLPNYRQYGIAKALAEKQEVWALANGFKSIKFKTQNRHIAMLLFAMKNGFNIYEVVPKADLANYRIKLIKHLL